MRILSLSFCLLSAVGAGAPAAPRHDPMGPPASDAAFGVRAIDETHFELDRRVLAGWVADRRWLDTARAVPAVDAGVLVGYKVFAIRPASLHARLGLRNGDTVLSVGGVSLASLDLATAPVALPKVGERIDVRVRRRGVELTLEYRIVGPAAVAAWPVAPPPVTSPSFASLLEPTPSAEIERAVAVGVRPIDATHYVIERPLVERLLANPMAIGGGCRVVPSIVGGKPRGFKLYRIKPGSIFARLGLADDDIIAAINGIAISSPDQALEAYVKIREASAMTLSVLRNGKPLTLHYSIQ